MATNSFDKLFQELVFNTTQNTDILSTGSNNNGGYDNFLDLDNFLVSGVDQDPMLGASDNSISTPTIDYPLPEINFPKSEEINKMEEEEPKVKVEKVGHPFDIPTTLVKDEPEAEEPVEQDDDDDWTPTVAKHNSRKRKMKPEVKNFIRAEADSKVKTCKRKKKLYESKPFDDPIMERNRQNAINAKINRDRKKSEKNALTKQMDLLRTENEKLKAQIRAKDKLLKKHGLL